MQLAVDPVELVVGLARLRPWHEPLVLERRHLLLRDGPVVVSASRGSGAANTLDGNASTRWDAQAPQAAGQWFQLNLGQARTFNKIVLDASSFPNDYPRGYEVFVSSDGVNWGSAIASGAGSGAVTTISFAAQTKQYVRIVLTDRVTSVSGTVSDVSRPQDGTARDYTVVVFPEDPAKWTFPSRYVRAVRTDGQGTFRMTGLPPERYFAVPLEFVEDGEWTDAEFLDRIRPDATSFSLADGERRGLDLRAGRR